MTNQQLFDSCKQILDSRFNGVVKSGKHRNCDDSHECCILELYSIVANKDWTDDPNTLRIFNIRPINDVVVSDSLRTEWMLKLLCAYEGSLDWPVEKQKEVVSKIVILTVNRLISNLPGLTEDIRIKCREAKTLEESRLAAANAAAANAAAANAAAANAAAYVAVAYTARIEADAANVDYAASHAAAAANAAYDAAYDAAAAMKEKIFIEACQIWLEAVGN